MKLLKHMISYAGRKGLRYGILGLSEKSVFEGRFTVMDVNKEKMKMKVFLILYIIFIILTFVGAFMVITHKLDNAGYAVVPMIFGLVFAMLYRNSKKAIEENK